MLIRVYNNIYLILPSVDSGAGDGGIKVVTLGPAESETNSFAQCHTVRLQSMGNALNTSSCTIADRILYSNSSGGLNLRASSSDAPGGCWCNGGSQLDSSASCVHRAGRA